MVVTRKQSQRGEQRENEETTSDDNQSLNQSSRLNISNTVDVTLRSLPQDNLFTLLETPRTRSNRFNLSDRNLEPSNEDNEEMASVSELQEQLDEARRANEELSKQLEKEKSQMSIENFAKIDKTLSGFTVPEDLSELSKVVTEWSEYISKLLNPKEEAKHFLATQLIKASKYGKLLRNYKGSSLNELIQTIKNLADVTPLQNLSSPRKQKPLDTFNALEKLNQDSTLEEKIRFLVHKQHLPLEEAQQIIRQCHNSEQVVEYLKNYEKRLDTQEFLNDQQFLIYNNKPNRLIGEFQPSILQTNQPQPISVNATSYERKIDQLMTLMSAMLENKNSDKKEVPQTNSDFKCMYHQRYATRAYHCDGPECSMFKPYVFTRKENNRYVAKNHNRQPTRTNYATTTQQQQQTTENPALTNETILEMYKSQQAQLSELQKQLLEKLRTNKIDLKEQRSMPNDPKRIRSNLVKANQIKQRPPFIYKQSSKEEIQRSINYALIKSNNSPETVIANAYKLNFKFIKNLKGREDRLFRVNNLKLSNSNKLMRLTNEFDGHEYLVDNGSQVSIIPSSLVDVNLIKRNTSKSVIVGIGGEPVGVLGLIRHLVKFKNKPYTFEFVVAEIDEPIIGIDFLRKHDLIIHPKLNSVIDVSSRLEFRCNTVCAEQIDGSKLNELLEEFRVVFESKHRIDSDLPVQHEINTVNDNIINSRPYYSSPELASLIKDHFLELLDRGIVERSQSRFCSPVTVAKKANGTNRYCIDFRKLNQNTVPDFYPLPHVQSFNYRASGCRIFSKLDLKDAYYNISIRKCDQHKTATLTPAGLFQFRKMPFGLRTAPQTFQRAMDHLFAHLPFVFTYIDDVIIYSPNPETHLAHLKEVLSILSNAGLSVNREKSKFNQTQLSFLSYKITSAGTTISDEHVQKFRELQVPRTIGQLRRTIGILNYFSRFIPRYSLLVRELTQIKSITYINFVNSRRKELNKRNLNKRECLVSKICASTKNLIGEELIVLNESQFKAFVELKKLMISQTVLHHPISNTTKILETDASITGYGAALYQLTSFGEKQLIYLTSGVFAERINTRTTYECELDGSYLAVRKLKKFLEGNPTILFTDNSQLVSRLLKPSIDLSVSEIKKLSTIVQYVTEVKHLPGTANGLADYLSREPGAKSNLVKKQINFISARVNNLYLGCTLDLSRLLLEQSKDPVIVNALQTDSTVFRKLVRLSPNQSSLAVFKRTKLNKEVLMVPQAQIEIVILAYHNVFHPGYKATLNHIAQKFYFAKMREHVRRVVRSCTECIRSKSQRQANLPQKVIDLPTNRFMEIHLDLVGPLYATQHGHQYVLTVIDRFTRYLTLIPLYSATSEEVIHKFTERYLSVFGVPLKIITDNGSCFIGQPFTQLVQHLRIQHIHTTPHHPKSNGLLERQHSKLKNSIRTLVNSDTHLEWDSVLPILQLYWNNASTHQSIYSPNQLTFGQNIPVATHFLEHNSVSESEITEVQILKFLRTLTDLRPRPIEHNSQVQTPLFISQSLNDCPAVYLKNFNPKSKLDHVYRGPFRVVERSADYLVIDTETEVAKKVSKQHLLPCYQIGEEDRPVPIPIVVRTDPVEQANRRFLAQRRAMQERRSVQIVPRTTEWVLDRTQSTILYPHGQWRPADLVKRN